MFQFLSRTVRPGEAAYDRRVVERDETVRTALAAALAAVVAFLLPTLTVGVDEATITGAVLALAVAALVRTGLETSVLVARTATVGPTARRSVPLVLGTRTTDPTHHPLRPRAPGSA